MNPWLKKNILTVALILSTWIFTVGYVKASVEWRLDSLEADVADVSEIVRRLELTTTRLETITSRLERMIE